MERDEPRETFCFAMAALSSTRRPYTVNKLSVTDLQCITTPSFVTLYMFDLVVLFLFAV